MNPLQYILHKMRDPRLSPQWMFLLFLNLWLCSIAIANSENINPAEALTNTEGLSASSRLSDTSPDVALYRKLLQHKRGIQKKALKKILDMKKVDKQAKMMKIILLKLFPILTNARVKLMEANYAAGDPFPQAEEAKDSLSTVLENTLFFGDLLLRLPDIIENMLDKEVEGWRALVSWAVPFCNDTKILTGQDVKLLNMMAQELKLVEMDPDYENPNRFHVIRRKHEEKRRQKEEVSKAALKAQKEKIRAEKRKQRGPRMSSSASAGDL